MAGRSPSTLLSAHESGVTPLESGYTDAFTVSFFGVIVTLGLCFLVPSGRVRAVEGRPIRPDRLGAPHRARGREDAAASHCAGHRVA